MIALAAEITCGNLRTELVNGLLNLGKVVYYDRKLLC